MNTRKIGVALATAALSLGFVAAAQPASAHTPTLSVDCGYVALQLTGYPAGSFTSAVVDGKTVWSETFGAGGFQDSVNFDPKTKHTYTVVVKSGDGDPRYSSTVSGATPEACYAVVTLPVEHTPEPTPEPTPPVVTEPPVVVTPPVEPPVVVPPVVTEPPVVTPPVVEPTPEPEPTTPPVVVTPELPEEQPITEPTEPTEEPVAPVTLAPVAEQPVTALPQPQAAPVLVAAAKPAQARTAQQLPDDLAFTGPMEVGTGIGVGLLMLVGGTALAFRRKIAAGLRR